MRTEAEATEEIMRNIYSARERIYEQTKTLSGAEYVSYLNNKAREVLVKSGYEIVYLHDGGYKIHKINES